MLKSVVTALILWLFAYTSLSLQANAQSTQGDSQIANDPDNKQDSDSPLTQLGTQYHNGIELLQNRFRIDFEVDEITMVFFRQFGSAPIVLVKPDGSKIFQSDADGENVFWFDSSTYDMISIKNPTPGPWQAVGQITPESRVMVISDLALHADPLPNMIFSGEILKQTAYLTNNGIPIDYTAFRDVVELTISLASTNNPNYNNFGADTEIVATLEDNGKGMDEIPLDGEFTGQFNLAIADGEWIPSFSVSTPMFTREQIDPNIMLLANPIKVDIELDGGGDGYHKLKVDAQREYVDMSTLLLDGKVRFPNGDIQNFSITDMSSDIREYLIVNYEYGVYRVKLTAYGNTIDGREFILDVPEYSFLTEEPKPTVVETTTEGMDATTNVNGVSEDNLLSEKVTPVENENMSTTMLVSVIVSINLILLIVGGSLIWWLTLDKKPNFELFKRSKAPIDSNETEEKPGFFAKIFKRKAKQLPPEKKSQAKEEPDPGIMELGIPKD